jgi:hypothetical protein
VTLTLFEILVDRVREDVNYASKLSDEAAPGSTDEHPAKLLLCSADRTRQHDATTGMERRCHFPPHSAITRAFTRWHRAVLLHSVCHQGSSFLGAGVHTEDSRTLVRQILFLWCPRAQGAVAGNLEE